AALVKVSLAWPEPARRTRPEPRAKVTGIACTRLTPGSAMVTVKRAVQAALQWKRTRSRPASAWLTVSRDGAAKENRGPRGGAAGVLNVRSAPTTVAAAPVATSR